jgi:hypothetical protein
MIIGADLTASSRIPSAELIDGNHPSGVTTSGAASQFEYHIW